MPLVMLGCWADAASEVHRRLKVWFLEAGDVVAGGEQVDRELAEGVSFPIQATSRLITIRVD